MVGKKEGNLLIFVVEYLRFNNVCVCFVTKWTAGNYVKDYVIVLNFVVVEWPEISDNNLQIASIMVINLNLIIQPG